LTVVRSVTRSDTMPGGVLLHVPRRCYQQQWSI